MPKLPILRAFPPLLMLGCSTSDLAQSWQIDRLRVLAVAAEPAEPRPGDVVTFSSLTVSPDVPWAASVWIACLDPSDSSMGCSIDPSLLDGIAAGDAITPEQQQALLDAGLIGVEPYFAPTWTVPLDALDALEADARLEGVTAFINITAIPDQDPVDERDLELAYKRVPVSEALTPNHNPAVLGLTVDGVAVPASASLLLDPGQSYELAPILADDAVEDYVFRNSAGEDEDRTEEPYVSWYLQEGRFDQPFSVSPDLGRVYTAPAEPAHAEASIWFVVRDRRGGMGWYEQPVSYR